MSTEETQVELKQCTKCREYKPRDTTHFGRQGTGFRGACKVCYNAPRIVDPENDKRCGPHITTKVVNHRLDAMESLIPKMIEDAVLPLRKEIAVLKTQLIQAKLAEQRTQRLVDFNHQHHAERMYSPGPVRFT